jgi:superfamily II DNA or RNA helicase
MLHKPVIHQQKAFDETMQAIADGKKCIMVQMPTRSGKSIVSTMLIEKYREQGVWFLAHTKILISQASKDLSDSGIKHGILMPGNPQLRYNVQVMSKDTLFCRLDKMLASGWKVPGLAIIDEAHLSMSARYSEIIQFLIISGCIVIGLSATPQRLDKKPFSPPFTHIVKGPTIKYLQEIKFTCEIDTFIVDRCMGDGDAEISRGEFSAGSLEKLDDKPFILANIVNHWKNLAAGLQTLVFCATVKHSEDMAESFCQNGIEARSLTSENIDEIDQTLADYYAGKFLVLCSVNLFVAGFTVKQCACIIQARRTMSLVHYLQSIGRGSMFSKEKKKLINLDCVNNFDRFYHPDMDREWALDAPRKKIKEESLYKRCPDCQRPVIKFDAICQHCGHVFEKRIIIRWDIEEADGKLVKVDYTDKKDINALVIAIARGARKIEKAYDIGLRMGATKEIVKMVWCEYLKNA